MSGVTGQRPPHRPWHAFTHLDHFAIVSYAVEIDRLESLLPAAFTAEPFEIDGRRSAVVSAVSCIDRDFRFRGLPWVTMSGGQIDYRAYVRHGEETGVWFLGAALDSALVQVPRVLWSMPWERATVEIDAEWNGRTCRRLRLSARSPLGDASLDLTDEAQGGSQLGPPTTVTDPLVGWYRPDNGHVRRYQVWHPPLDLQPADVRSARYELFENLELVEPDQTPMSAVVQRTVDLDVFTPPRRDGVAV